MRRMLRLPRLPRLGFLLAVVFGGLAALLPAAALAWLPDGHMATGALAYDALERRDPQAVAAVVRIMQFHPERARFDRTLGDLVRRHRQVRGHRGRVNRAGDRTTDDDFVGLAHAASPLTALF